MLVPGTYVSDHVGIIESVNADSTVTVIEGNTGSANGEVMRRVRAISLISCAGRPDYDDTDGTAVPDIFYRVRSGGRWLPEIKNTEDYAGLPGTAITDVAVRVSEGEVKYRVHLRSGGWLPYVSGCDITDHENGYAGDRKAIDALELVYLTPPRVRDAHGRFRARYRVSPLCGGYYDWQYDAERSGGQDGYAGSFSIPVDRIQIMLAE